MFNTEAMGQFLEESLTSNSQLCLGGVKIILNEAMGGLVPSQAELNRQVFDAHKAGFQVAIHAITPNAVESAITALEYALKHLPYANRRHRLEHCSECPPGQLERLSKLQLIIVTQPSFVYYSGDRYLAKLPGSRLQYLYRIKSLMNAGLVVAGGSDSPVVSSNPLIGIYAAVTRRARTGQVVLPEECISLNQALAMYTINGAYASFEEGIKGSITRGKLADVVMLGADLMKLPPEQIKDIRIEMTIIDGKIVWEAR